MHIEYIRLKNFRALQDVEMRDISRLSILVGANGTGKSTLFQVFAFLKDALNENVRGALTRLGGSRGFAEARSRNADGPIEIELKFRQSANHPRITYLVCINERDRQPVVEREILRYRRGSKGQSWHFLDFAFGEGEAVDKKDSWVPNAQREIHCSPR